MKRSFILQGLECQASIGIYELERASPQRITVDAELMLSLASEPLNDQVESTLNYDVIRETIHRIVSKKHYDLQETLARCLFEALRSLDGVQSVRVQTSKPDAYNDCKTIAYELSDL
ncbi:dihydroneopterin aldolase [Candidatus Puniceispirillum sp.]|nr:dihydroneopterin aldolase [Candidatus Puniceispirillum sp.]